MRTGQWVFTDGVDADRVAAMSVYSCFEDVLALIAVAEPSVAVTIESAHSHHLDRCKRAALRFTIPETAFDMFFNSAAGYRAQYCTSPEAGEEANNTFLRTFSGLFLSAIERDLTSESDRSFAEQSLRAKGARVWAPDDAGESLLGHDQLVVHIAVPRWRAHAEASWRGEASPELGPECAKAVRGVLAPLATSLEIKGGWIHGGTGEPRADPYKAARSQDIHEYGWT